METLLKDMPIESIPVRIGGTFAEYNEPFDFDLSEGGPLHYPGAPSSSPFPPPSLTPPPLALPRVTPSTAAPPVSEAETTSVVLAESTGSLSSGRNGSNSGGGTAQNSNSIVVLDSNSREPSISTSIPTGQKTTPKGTVHATATKENKSSSTATTGEKKTAGANSNSSNVSALLMDIARTAPALTYFALLFALFLLFQHPTAIIIALIFPFFGWVFLSYITSIFSLSNSNN